MARVKGAGARGALVSTFPPEGVSEGWAVTSWCGKCAAPALTHIHRGGGLPMGGGGSAALLLFPRSSGGSEKGREKRPKMLLSIGQGIVPQIQVF